MTKGTIVVDHLVKTYKDKFTAVNDVSFTVGKGECFAFLGPNGAGKSTTVKVLTTLSRLTSGSVTISGIDVDEDPEKVRWEIGVVLQDTGLDSNLTARELLELQGRIFHLSGKEASFRAEELLAVVGLTEEADRTSKKFSGGMKRRLDLAMTLVHRPGILFLDEPTTGLDPLNRKSIWKEIRRLNREEGTTVFLTTQYLEEADELADQIQIISGGKIVAGGTPAELKQSIGKDVISMQFVSETEAKKAREVLNKRDVFLIENDIRVTEEKASAALPVILRELQEFGLEPAALSVAEPTLDDVFIQVTGSSEGAS
ncbi:ATP-binding cassette domain-containing protein [Alkalicoccus luteus]|uniref:ATP-binding cassette domain-containing protein n=1 Tax=Alkalicoccus luteus TaxID=1237094 RepID=A0A969PNQ4_9BACI|nr:ATP-binding cassette domain-containing protein [Alkalicoccus luteus]NJP37587.1 ATP-binding cassette domain-containing protein [Alkalicoccus luteus]